MKKLKLIILLLLLAFVLSACQSVVDNANTNSNNDGNNFNGSTMNPPKDDTTVNPPKDDEDNSSTVTPTPPVDDEQDSNQLISLDNISNLVANISDASALGIKNTMSQAANASANGKKKRANDSVKNVIVKETTEVTGNDYVIREDGTIEVTFTYINTQNVTSEICEEKVIKAVVPYGEKKKVVILSKRILEIHHLQRV